MSHRKTMKAALHTDALKLDTIEKEIPQVTDCDQVLLKVGAVGFCGSDKHDMETAPRVKQTPGHEFAGIIEEVGGEPSDFQVGDRVVVLPGARCGECDGCKERPRGKCERPGVYGCRGVQHPPGAMAEYVLVRTENLTKIPDDVSLECAAMADPLAVAIHSVNIGPDVGGQTCVVMGAGVIGLLIAEVLALRGAGRIALVDVLPSHLEAAKKLGEFDTFMGDDRDKLVLQLEELESGIYYELAGGETPTLDIAVQCINRNGAILLVSQRPKGVWLNYQWVMGKQLTLQGVSGHTAEAWREALDLVFGHRIETDMLITHRYPIEQANEALMTAVEGDSLKVMLKPNGEVF